MVMMKSPTHSIHFMQWWLTLTLTASATLSAPFLIEGVSYVKVLIALCLSSCMMPMILIRLFNSVSVKAKFFGLIFFISINMYLLYLISNSYRSVFGAPGRNNGFLNVIVCIYFFAIGIYIKKFWTILNIYKTISVVSVCSSVSILAVKNLEIGLNSIFASNNFNSVDFSDNSNLIAPLISVGILSSIISFKKTENFMYLFFLFPLAIVAIQLSVLQVYLNLAISLLILGTLKFKQNIKAIWIPISIFGGYLLGLVLALQGLFDRDSSLTERTDILREAGNLWNEFRFFPHNIDGLSDYTKNFSSVNGIQLLDDFHNVFLQTSFSFGLVIGILFLVLSLTPYFVYSKDHRGNLEFLSVYTSLLVSLLIGIVSPNYIYIFFLLLGYSCASLLNSHQLLPTNRSNLVVPAFGLSILLVMIPAFIQVDDLITRFKISDRATKIKALNSFTESNFIALVHDLREIDDAEYRNRMALNFYSIDECNYGDSVYKMMVETNFNEARLRRLEAIKEACIQG